MKEFIGVKHLLGVYDTASIKQEALMFDRVAVVDYGITAPLLRKGACPGTYDYYDDLEYLLEKGIIFEPEKISPSDKLLGNEEFQQYSELYNHHLEEARKLPLLVETSVEEKEEIVSSAAYSFFVLNYYEVRRMTMILREMKGMDAYPIFTLPCGHSPFQETEHTKNEVVEISLKSLPVPDLWTPWEQILDYREDPDSKIKFSRLRNWMSKVAHTENNPNEIEEEFATLIDEYTQHMKTHKIKTQLDTLKTIVVAEVGLFTGGWLTGVGTLPGLIGMLATPLYSIKQRQIELTKEELNAPGKEIAYIVKASEAFPAHQLNIDTPCEYCGGEPLN